MNNFTREDTNDVSSTENRFKGKDSEYLSKLVVIPSMITEQIGTKKEN